MSWTLAQFCIGSTLVIFGLPFVAVPAASLYSKFIILKIQGTMWNGRIIDEWMNECSDRGKNDWYFNGLRMDKTDMNSF